MVRRRRSLPDAGISYDIASCYPGFCCVANGSSQVACVTGALGGREELVRGSQTVGGLGPAAGTASLRLARCERADTRFSLPGWLSLAPLSGAGRSARLTSCHGTAIPWTIGTSNSRRGGPQTVRPSRSTSTSNRLPDRTRRSSRASDNCTIRRSRSTAASTAKTNATMSRPKAAFSSSEPKTGSTTRRSTSEPGCSVPRATEPKSDACKGLTVARPISALRVEMTGWASRAVAQVARRTSSREKRRCPPRVRSQGILPSAAHFRTVTGCTPSSRATSPAVNVLAT